MVIQLGVILLMELDSKVLSWLSPFFHFSEPNRGELRRKFFLHHLQLSYTPSNPFSSHNCHWLTFLFMRITRVTISISFQLNWTVCLCCVIIVLFEHRPVKMPIFLCQNCTKYTSQMMLLPQKKQQVFLMLFKLQASKSELCKKCLLYAHSTRSQFVLILNFFFVTL